MKRLWVQQTLAFSAIVFIAMGVVVVWINQSADSSFFPTLTGYWAIKTVFFLYGKMWLRSGTRLVQDKIPGQDLTFFPGD